MKAGSALEAAMVIQIVDFRVAATRHTGSRSVEAQRTALNVLNASSSDIRMTLANDRVRAAADSPERETVSQDHWQTLAKRHIKVELTRAGVGYSELAARLTEMGLTETEGSVTVKINRGAFPAWFLLAVMKAIGAHTVRLHETD